MEKKRYNDILVRLPPFFYVHVKNLNSNVLRIEVGPQTFTCLDHETVVHGPDAMVSIPPKHYCVISNPVCRDADGKPIQDKHGQIKLRHGDSEVRLEQEPFPLYPGEVAGQILPLQVVHADTAIRLKALRDFDDKTSSKEPVHRLAGEEWLFIGPATYVPQVEAQNIEVVNAIILKANQALRLRARRELLDSTKTKRMAGEEWLVRMQGSYLPCAYEEVLRTVDAYILTEDVALRLKASKAFVDVFGKERKAGEEWLVTSEMADTHIPDVYEDVVCNVKRTTLTSRQYCVLVNPVDERGRPQLGKRQLLRGEKTFFLYPGEVLESGVRDVYVLGQEEALLLKAREAFEEEVPATTASRGLLGIPLVPVMGVRVEAVHLIMSTFFVLNVATRGLAWAIEAVQSPVIASLVVVMLAFALGGGRQSGKVKRGPGQRWFVYGPLEYLPPLEVEVVEKRRAMVQVEALNLYMFFFERR